MFATQRNLPIFCTFRRDAGILGILNHRNQRLQLLRSEVFEFFHDVCISEKIKDAKLKTIKYPNGTRTHSGIKWILSSISYPTFFPQLPQNAIPAFNGVPHSEQKRGFTLSSAGAGAGVGADFTLSASGSEPSSESVIRPNVRCNCLTAPDTNLSMAK